MEPWVVAEKELKESYGLDQEEIIDAINEYQRVILFHSSHYLYFVFVEQ